MSDRTCCLGGWGRVSGRAVAGQTLATAVLLGLTYALPFAKAQQGAELPAGAGSALVFAQEDRSPAEPATDPSVEASTADLPKSEDTLATGPSPSRESSAAPTAALIERWPYFSPVDLPALDKAQTICDFLVTPPIFDKARSDLGDLRLFDAAGREVPYALRVRQPVDVDQLVAASEFNRVELPSGSTEVTLDLGENPPEQNSLDVVLPGTNFRRLALLEGSDDNQQWKTLVERANLVRFVAGSREFDERRISYPPSRYRYLRLRVDRDPEVDAKAVEVGAVTAHRKVEVPGEMVTLDARLGEREPVSVDGNPGSAWFVDLGADNMPCQRLLADVADAEFARDWRVQKANVPDEWPAFFELGNGQWRRRAGDARVAMVAGFPETTARQLRLEVVDFRNPPLDIKSVQFMAAAREVIFVRTESLQMPLRLYYGNLQAEPPHYDIERNLPAQLEVPPLRVQLGDRQPNPAFRPAPLPLTERLPWLIYIVLGAASLALGLVILNLGRTAIARHDGALQ